MAGSRTDPYTLNPPKRCRFCGDQMNTRTTQYGKQRVDIQAVFDHFREHPACQHRLAGRAEV